MNIWRFVPRRFMAWMLHPLAVRFIAWRLRRHRPSILDPLF